MKYSVNPNGMIECYSDDFEFLGIVGMMENEPKQDEDEGQK